ncbi:ABC transporter transmembrane domain-containing protein [Brachybacterium sp.]|uniref:ABC transporter transmembrane domain-containing protein n=1 Tax=Brachybacterium sp. TaxID=1891286 RepID=UPI002ED4EFC1
MNANATPDNPVQPAAAPADAEEPSWIEIGSPKRRTAPPAWSDEASGDAWVASGTPSVPDETEERPVSDSPRAVGEAEPDPVAHEVAPDPDAHRMEPDAGLASEAAEAERHAPVGTGATDEDLTTDPAEDQGSDETGAQPSDTSEAEGFRLRKAPRTPSQRPFRRPAERDAVHSGGEVERGGDEIGEDVEDVTESGDEAAAPPVQPARTADAWVQDPVPSADEPTESTELTESTEPTEPTELTESTEPVEASLGPVAETPAPEESASAESSDPESGERWHVVTDEGQDSAAASSPAAAPSAADVPTPATAQSSADVPPSADVPAPAAAQTRPRAFPVPGFPVPMRPESSTTEIGPREDARREPVGRASESTDRAPEPVERAAEPVGRAPESGERAPETETETQVGTDAEQGRRNPGSLGSALDLMSPHLQAHRPALVLGMVTLVLGVWMLVALPFPLKYSVDAALAVAGAGSTAPDGIGAEPTVALFTAAGIFAGLVALQAGLRALSASVLNRAGGRAATDLRGRLLGHLHRLSPGRDLEDPARTTRPLIDDVAHLRDLVAEIGPRLLAGLLALTSLLVVVLVVEPIAAAVAALTAGLAALASAWTLRRERRTEAAAAADEAALTETADELLAATRTIQSYGLEERAGRSLGTLGTRAARSRATDRGARAVGGFLTQLIAGLGVGAALLIGGWRMTSGTMTPGELTMVIAYVLLAVGLAREVTRLAVALPGTRHAADRVGELLARRVETTEPRRTQSIDRLRGEVVYSALSTTGAHGALFDRISLVIPAGQHVALVGREGAEASALLSYLQRFDQPDTGRVLLDRFDTRVLAVADLRSRLAVVQRESALFTETVRENIRVGRPEASDDEILEAARRTGADEFITLLPDGYDTVLVRRGAGLSDGQRRRIAITRALLREAPVVVLDGADEDLAHAEREDVRRALDVLAAGRTTLISSRDRETILAADRVLCFESGDLAEDGAPAPLAEDPDSWLSSWLHAADLASR